MQFCWCFWFGKEKCNIRSRGSSKSQYVCVLGMGYVCLILINLDNMIFGVKQVCCPNGNPLWILNSMVKIYMQAMIYWAFIDTSMWFRWLMGPVFCVGVLSVHFFYRIICNSSELFMQVWLEPIIIRWRVIFADCACDEKKYRTKYHFL